MASKDLEEALDALFTDPPERFLETRDALAKELKAAGDKAGSARVKALLKPTQVAQALNRLAREAKPELEALFEAGRALASGKDFKAALDLQRSALDAVFKKATGSDVPAIMGVLRGALVDPVLTEQVRLGRFSKLPEVKVGFFGVPEATPAKEPIDEVAIARAKAAERAKHEAQSTAQEDERAKLEAAKAEQAANEEAERARRELHAAEKAAREERLKRELHDAQKEAAALEADAARIERDAIAARRRADEAAERVAKLERG